MGRHDRGVQRPHLRASRLNSAWPKREERCSTGLRIIESGSGLLLTQRGGLEPAGEALFSIFGCGALLRTEPSNDSLSRPGFSTQEAADHVRSAWSMVEERIRFAVANAGLITAIRSTGSERARYLFIYAPGAGSNLADPFGAFLSDALVQKGVECWRFQFPYMESGRKSPDRTAVLEATWRAMIEAAGASSSKVIIGGRSMGGRIASHAVAQGARVDGLALFAYPLHPPGSPEKTRDEHLRSITVPTVFCSGTRDAFASPDELRQASRLVQGAVLHILEGADHAFSVMKASGRTRNDVWKEAKDALLAFLASIH